MAGVHNFVQPNLFKATQYRIKSQLALPLYSSASLMSSLMIFYGFKDSSRSYSEVITICEEFSDSTTSDTSVLHQMIAILHA